MKSPIPWIGGKSLLKNKILDIFHQKKRITDLLMSLAVEVQSYFPKINTLIWRFITMPTVI